MNKNIKRKHTNQRVLDMAAAYVGGLGEIVWDTDHESLAMNGYYDGYHRGVEAAIKAMSNNKYVSLAKDKVYALIDE